MYPNTALVLTSFLLGLCLVVALVEHSLYGGLNRVYYTHGLPLVIQRIPVASPSPDSPPVAALRGQFRSALIGSLGFHEIAPNTYAFHRQFFQPALLPGTLMHGVLLFDRANGHLVLKAFVSVWVVLLILAVGVYSALGPLAGWYRLLPIGIVCVIFGIPLLLERRRCLQLARFAATAWETVPGSAASPRVG